MAKKGTKSDGGTHLHNTTNVIAGNTTNNYFIYIVVLVVGVLFGIVYFTGIIGSEPQQKEHIVKAGEGKG